mmetsp:Transcript_13472/g.26912  ORF Transcript_13472/g.26912 Transcript_13472/m.26912 type:complete len:274 (+) Transcript_13472:25-846(+)
MTLPLAPMASNETAAVNDQNEFGNLATFQSDDSEEENAVPDLQAIDRKKLDVKGAIDALLETTDPTSSFSDCDSSEDLCFDPWKMGQDMELVNSHRTARRVMPIGGSRMTVSQFGASSGKVVWKVRVDKCGIEQKLWENKTAQIETATRMLRQNMHGVKIGVAQKGASLKWFAGFDRFSYGLDWQGSVWTEGKQIKTHLIDGDRGKTVRFQAGDVVSVEVDFESMVLKYAVNDVPLPGAYYLSTLQRNAEMYLAISLLWPGEQVTFLSEELYE